ncbi:MAG TPA: TldD/PmbA family protein, partial [Longimicrobiaceae bacterium]|nr:TldD/PmbA family protein [Longimicrobiaceae bacterium]
MDRREFLVQGALVTAGLAAFGPEAVAGIAPGALVAPQADPAVRELAMRALDAAKLAGATYADVRVSRNRNQSLATRERQITSIGDTETYGFGVRVLAGGSWGFTASREMTLPEAERVARQAVAQARANSTARLRPVTLAPTESYPDATWRSPVQVDPFDIPVEEKVALMLAANEEALRVQGARFVNFNMFFLREEKTFASTEGTFTYQIVYRSFPRMTITAVGNGDFQTLASTDVQPMALGYEHVRDSRFLENAPRWAETAVKKLSAKPVQPGRYDLVLLPSHLWLTIHESIAHPAELDRILGFEANYAGTSFISPLDRFLGRFRYGPDFLNIQGERSARGGLSTVGWDDEGVKPDEYLIVRNGILNDLQTTREQAPLLADWYRSQGRPVRSHGNSYAESWADVQFQRMPNVNLLPHPER